MIRWLTIYLFALASALNPALAALTVNQLSGFNAYTSGAAPPSDSVSFNGCTTDTTSQSTYTFSSVSIGAAETGRLILVGAGYEDLSSVIAHPTFTIGGVDAVEVSTSSSTYTVGSGFAIAALSTGTTATISLAFAETVDVATICVWSLYGFSSAAFSANDADNVPGASGASFPLDVSVTAGDLVAGICVTGGPSETIASDADWTTTNWTKGNSTEAGVAYAYAFPYGSTGAKTFTCDWSGGTDAHGRVVVVTP